MRIGRTEAVFGNGPTALRRAGGGRVEPIDRSASPRRELPRETPESASRALVPTAAPAVPESPAERLARYRTHTPFIAHLIGQRDDAEALRVRRRAPPALAAATYDRAMAGAGLLVPGYFVDAAL
ncbi:hypothetical protein EYW49_14505 [Siculibacillus lacustris]|uniref:Uncharacterized protein n=1 Tax=Siculibacillus lacustris TaxID=1549641 RepID=A0A4Q9VM15_9HYPH|nr:hypothetical protein [Siculibacillus lacustris]TBW36312.1 hypothetical protein EYW49_14505 [Siculibacillus lacustris]